MTDARTRASKLKADLAKAVADASRQEFDRRLSPTNLKRIGDRVIAKMLQQISKGISPVAGYGRFPEYKSRTNARDLRKQASNLGKAARSAPNAQKKKQIRDRQKKLRGLASEAQRKGYPDSLGKKVLAQTGKKARPVNLKLYGDFLENLEAKVRGRVNNRIVEIGYFKNSEAIKELGHREGANGQAVRPTIPQGDEQFNAVIDAEILKAIDEVLKRRL